MKSHNVTVLTLLEDVIIDLFQSIGINPKRDLDTIRSRVENEGISFLTIALPSFCSDFEQSLELGRVPIGAFRNFKKAKRIPALLQGIVGLIFDRESGTICQSPDPYHIYVVRQICNLVKKIKLPCTLSRDNDAIGGYLEIEEQLKSKVGKEDILAFYQISKALWSSPFRFNLDLSDLEGKHGPGATADGRVGNKKYSTTYYPARLDRGFPYLGFWLPIGSRGSKEEANLQLVSTDTEIPVKVLSVPKTLKTSRIIAKEPTAMQYAQQALSTVIRGVLETHIYTKGHINFESQDVNRQLALRSSGDRSLATLDLSAASDRVPNYLVRLMLTVNKDLRFLVDSCRSKKAKIAFRNSLGSTKEKVIKLRKFASMGSALCFPIEAMYFYTICVMALIEKHKLPLCERAIKFACSQIYVYGDDIIVPSDCADIVKRKLETYHLKVSSTKSFSNGFFRESCGMDAYQGEEVTPIYLRQSIPSSRSDASRLVSLVSFRNQIYKKGCWRTAKRIDEFVYSLLRGVYPLVGWNSSGVGRHSFLPGASMTSWDTGLQIPVVKVFVPRSSLEKSKISSYHALAKCLTSGRTISFIRKGLSTEGHDIEHAPKRFSLKLRKARAAIF